MRRSAIAILMFLTMTAGVWAQNGPVRVITDSRHDTSRPLRELALEAQKNSADPEVTEFRTQPLMPPAPETVFIDNGPMTVDRALQGFMGTSGPSTIFQNFDGVPNLSGVAPPDPTLAVGPNHVVQMVNSKFAIWDKQGNQLMAPVNINTLFSGFGGGCETGNDGDPIALYDHVADRFVLTQFDFGNGMCIAVSQTPDPLGAYHRYSFSTPGNDYPKLGVWGDAYTGTIRAFNANFDMQAWAFERDQMLLGQTAQAVSFSMTALLPGIDGFLPSDLDGPPSAPGTPMYFLGHQDGPNRLAMFEVNVDWSNTANSTISGPTFLPVDPYDSNLGTGIPQPVGPNLDALGGFTMYRLAYRDFGTHQSMVTNHTVDVNDFPNHAGVRWYELRNEGSGWSVFQQGTYAPDEENRWMGSIAMGANGEIALGYTVSSSTTFPSIRHTGRQASDPPGVMTLPEETIIAGGGGQLNVSRWGDYAHMDVDPVTDTTFWFTHEYVQSTGSFNWRTRIAEFSVTPFNGDHDYGVGPFVNLPAMFYQDTTANVGVMVSNNGNLDETDVKVTFLVDDVALDSQFVSLLADSSTVINFTWTPDTGTAFGLEQEMKVIAFLDTDELPSNDQVRKVVPVFNDQDPATEQNTDHVTSLMRATVTNEGNIGFLNEFPPAGPGNGFQFNPATGSGQRLFEGGIIVATDANHVSDAARDEEQVFDADFQFLTNIADESAGDYNIFRSRYADLLAENPISVSIEEVSYSANVSGYESILALAYYVTNTSGADIPALHLGAYYDWDVASSASDRGQVVTDSTNSIVGVNNGNPFPIEILEIHPGAGANAYIGIVPLTTNVFEARRVLIQADEVYPPRMTDGDKWQYITQNRATNPNGDGGSAQDHGHGFGLPPVSLDNGETKLLGYAIAAGTNFSEMVDRARKAQELWVTLGNDIEIIGATGISDNGLTAPLDFALHQNYPNPFNPTTTIRYDLKARSKVALTIYNALGQEVRNLVSDTQNAGRYQVQWDGRDNTGGKVASGIYFYRLRAGDFVQFHKMVLLK